MTQVELVCKWLLAAYIEQLLRPGFTRLPPARFWHLHPNARKPRISWYTTALPPRDFVYARRKWTLDQSINGTRLDRPQSAALRMRVNDYSFVDLKAPVSRTVESLRILEEIDKTGETCGVQRRNWNPKHKRTITVPGHSFCYCSRLEGHVGYHRSDDCAW